jgi:hypothetical protein
MKRNNEKGKRGDGRRKGAMGDKKKWWEDEEWWETKNCDEGQKEMK